MSQVLIVDNDPTFAHMVEIALTKRGFETITASDGLRALQIARDRQPLCIVLDLILPKVSGDRVVNYLAEDYALSQIPVILVSGALIESQPFLPHGNVSALIPKGPLESTISEIVKAVESLKERRATGSDAVSSGGRSGFEPMTSRRSVSELLEMKHHYEQIIRTISEGVIEVDSDIQIVFVNPAVEKMLEMEWPSLVGLDLFSIIPVEDTPLLRNHFRRLAAKDLCSSSVFTLRIDGKTFRVHITPLFETGSYSGSILTFQDITIDRNRDLRRSAFLAYLGHEVKNALSLMGGQVGLLAQGREAEFDLTRDQILAYVTRETARLLRLIRDVSRLDKSEGDLFHLGLEPVDLAEVVRESLSAVQARIRHKRLTLITHLPPSLPHAMGSKDRLIQVCQNLLANAVKFTPEGGRIIVSAHQHGDQLELTIQDTGPGIPPQILERVLAKDPEDIVHLDLGVGRRRMGLGLLITKGIVDAHGGELSVESQPGGSTIRVSVPAAQFHKGVRVKQGAHGR